MPPLTTSGTSGTSGAGGQGGFFQAQASAMVALLEKQSVILDKNLATIQKAREELARATISGSSNEGVGEGGGTILRAGPGSVFGLIGRATR